MIIKASFQASRWLQDQELQKVYHLTLILEEIRSTHTLACIFTYLAFITLHVCFIDFVHLCHLAHTHTFHCIYMIAFVFLFSYVLNPFWRDLVAHTHTHFMILCSIYFVVWFVLLHISFHAWSLYHCAFIIWHVYWSWILHEAFSRG